MLSAAHTWSLSAISVATGFVMLWVFRRFSDQRRLQLAKRKLRAQMYAFRLFADEPALIFRAQKELLLWNSRYLWLMLRPTAVMIVPIVALLIHLEAVYGRRTLRSGEAAIVSVKVADAIDPRTLSPTLEGHGVTVETPPVRVSEEHQICWRVRAASAGRGSVLLRMEGVSERKRVESESGVRYLSERRVAGFPEWLLYPAEGRLEKGPVAWIEVRYPAADIEVFGFGMHWLVWFFVVSSVTMIAFRRRFGVTF